MVVLAHVLPAFAQEGMMVEIATARHGEIQPVLRLPGTLVSPHVVRLSAEVGGRLDVVAGEPGATLASGTIVFRLNPENHRLGLDSALAARETARRQLDELRAGTRPEEISRLQALEQHATAALAQIRNDKKRLAGLKAGQAISNAQWDDVEFREKMAMHQLEAAQQALQAARRGRTPEQIAIAAAQFDQAQVQVRQAEKALRDTQVAAPFAAVLVQKYREPGETVAPGEPVAQIQCLDPLRVRFFVGEAQLLSLRSSLQLEVSVPALQAVFPARLVSVTPTCDETTRRFPCEAEFANADHRALPGLSAEVCLRLPPMSGTIIPLTALVDRNDGIGVFVVESGLARFKPVREVAREGDSVLVEGIGPESTVVSRGALGLRDGATVQVRSAEAAPVKPLETPGQPTR